MGYGKPGQDIHLVNISFEHLLIIHQVEFLFFKVLSKKKRRKDEQIVGMATSTNQLLLHYKEIGSILANKKSQSRTTWMQST